MTSDDFVKTLIDSAISVLNEALAADHTAMLELFNVRPDCNKALAEHKSIQVLAKPDDTYDFGVMGLINGLFGTDSEGRGLIAMDCEVEKLDNDEFRILEIKRFYNRMRLEEAKKKPPPTPMPSSGKPRKYS